MNKDVRVNYSSYSVFNYNHSKMSEIIDDKHFVPLIEPTDAGIDLPDDRDWHYSDIMELKEDEMGGSIEVDIDKIKTLLTIFDQWARWETQKACGEYWLRHCDNAQHLFVDGVQVDPFQWWLDYQPWRAESAKRQGTSIQWNLGRFKNTGIIAGYALAMSIYLAKQAIDNRNFIYTGSNDWDRTSVRTTGIYKQRTDGKIVGHLFCIVGYDDIGFIAVNSYWPENWYFTIPYNSYRTLYSRYAVFWLTEKDLLLTYRAMKTIEEAVKEGMELWLTNWHDLKSPMTGERVVTIVIRALDIVKELIANK